MESPTFWNDQEKAKAVIQELKSAQLGSQAV